METEDKIATLTDTTAIHYEIKTIPTKKSSNHNP